MQSVAAPRGAVLLSSPHCGRAPREDLGGGHTVTTSETLLPPARTAEAPAPRPSGLRGRLSGGHVVMVVAALAAAVLNYGLLRAADDGVRVVVASRALEAGTPVEAEAFASAEVTVDDAVLASLVRTERAGDLEGWVPITAVPEGAPVRLADLQPPSAPDEGRAMSLPVEAAHAVGGDLQVGDRIDVIAVRDGEPAYVLVDTPVLATSDSGAGASQAFSSGTGFTVTVAVDERSALDLAAAINGDAVEIVRSTGAAPLTLPTGTDG